MPNIIVPRGAKRSKRDMLAHEYGPKLVRDAEHDVLVAIFLEKRLLDYDELLDRVARRLKDEDATRRHATDG